MIHIYTGNGKGKTTAGLGLCARCAGYDKRIAVFQFMKTSSCGEYKTLKDKCDFYYSDKKFGFLINMSNVEKQIASDSTKRLFNQFLELIDNYDLILLDEIISSINVGFIDIGLLLDITDKFKSQNKELILTGRDAPDRLIDVADYVSKICSVKHPYELDIPARKGIEY